MHILVMLMILIKHLSSLIIALKYFHKIQSSPEVDKLLYLAIVFLNSSLEKSSHSKVCFDRISFNRLELIWWFYAKLNIWYNTCQRLLISIQGCLLNYSALIASNLCFLTQFTRSHGLQFFKAISWILSSKNKYFIFLTTSLKIF